MAALQFFGRPKMTRAELISGGPAEDLDKGINAPSKQHQMNTFYKQLSLS